MTFIIPVLAMLTMLGFLVHTLWSKEKLEEARKDPNDKPSSLAKDGDPHDPNMDI